MSVRQYIGARYVPIFGRVGEDSIEWDNTKPYEPLTIVLYQGNSYTSRQYVPVGIDIANEAFWALTGNYNAQVEAYRSEVQGFDNRIDAVEDGMETIRGDITNLQGDITRLDEKIDDDVAEVNAKIDAFKQDKVIASNYIRPELVGNFTAFNGKFITADANADNPYLPQGFCFVQNNEFMQLLINQAQTSMKPVQINTANNYFNIPNTSKSGFGHANQMEYVPSTGNYYINDGLGHILVCNSSFNIINSVTVPNEEWAVFVYDRKTEKAYVLDYYSNVYNFDLANNTIESAGYTLSKPVQDGTVTVQGAACYNNILVFPVSKNPTGLICYNIATGEYLQTIQVDVNANHVFPVSEIEDVSFTDEGDLYFSSATVLSAENYCNVCIIWKCNIFTGMPTKNWWSLSTEKHDVYVECANYTGLLSDGSPNYPFKSLEETSIHLQHATNNVKSIFLGYNSAYSTDTQQSWFGFLYMSNINAYIRINSNQNITIYGSIEFRGACNAWLLNRFKLASCYNTPKNFLFRVDNSTVRAQTIEGVSGFNDGAISSVVLMQYVVDVVINAIVPNAFTNIRTNQIHGAGYAINVSPRNLDGSWS